jgi:hypothetical protein
MPELCEARTLPTNGRFQYDERSVKWAFGLALLAKRSKIRTWTKQLQRSRS